MRDVLSEKATKAIKRLAAAHGGHNVRVLGSVSEEPGNADCPVFLVDMYGKCFRDADGDETFGEVFIETSEDETIGSATVMGAHTGVSGGYIESNSPEIALRVGQSKASSSFPSAYGDAFAPAGIDAFAIRAPNGTAIDGSNMVGAKQETVPGGEGPYGPGDVCLFDGYVVTPG